MFACISSAMMRSAYIASGANRASSCSSISDSGLLAFGADRALALWCSSNPEAGVFSTLPGHSAEVTVVKSWTREGAEGFISGDALGRVIIWNVRETQVSSMLGIADEQVEKVCAFEAHTGSSISALAFISNRRLGECVATGASDGILRIWALEDGKARLAQELELKGKLPLDIQLATLPGSEGMFASCSSS